MSAKTLRCRIPAYSSTGGMPALMRLRACNTVDGGAMQQCCAGSPIRGGWHGRLVDIHSRRLQSEAEAVGVVMLTRAGL